MADRPHVVTPPPADWPVDDLMAARERLEAWLLENAGLDPAYYVQVEVRIVKRRDTPDAPFGLPPRDMALVTRVEVDELRARGADE